MKLILGDFLEKRGIKIAELNEILVKQKAWENRTLNNFVTFKGKVKSYPSFENLSDIIEALNILEIKRSRENGKEQIEITPNDILKTSNSGLQVRFFHKPEIIDGTSLDDLYQKVESSKSIYKNIEKALIHEQAGCLSKAINLFEDSKKVFVGLDNNDWYKTLIDETNFELFEGKFKAYISCMNGLGRALRKAGRLIESEKIYTDILAKITLWSLQASVIEKKFPKSSKHINRFLKDLRKMQGRLLRGRGTTHRYRGRTYQALRDLEGARKASEDSKDMFRIDLADNEIAFCWASSGNYDKAIQAFEATINDPIYNPRIIAYAEIGLADTQIQKFENEKYSLKAIDIRKDIQKATSITMSALEKFKIIGDLYGLYISYRSLAYLSILSPYEPKETFNKYFSEAQKKIKDIGIVNLRAEGQLLFLEGKWSESIREDQRSKSKNLRYSMT